MVIDDTGSVEDIHAFIYCKKWIFGRVLPMPDSQCKDRATQLLTKYKSGALVTQFVIIRSMLVTCDAVEIGVVDVDVDIDTDLQLNFAVFFVPLSVFVCDYLVNTIMIESG